ncbi:hypothetical protein OKW34_000929 [Paraburkholderia youngii]|uniref:hypothetical protein n=1 Tax=Paraburkholderia youngii TaxID=2782701 RepID=UPI003D230047
MAIDLKVGAHRSCTLHTRHEYRGSTSSDEVRTGRQLIASASPWELTRDASQLVPHFQSSPNDINQEAASFRLSPAEKTECMQRWEDDHNLCWAIGKPMGGYGTVQACMDRARYNYNICMGFTQQYEHSTLTPATKINRCRLRS